MELIESPLSWIATARPIRLVALGLLLIGFALGAGVSGQAANGTPPAPIVSSLRP